MQRAGEDPRQGVRPFLAERSASVGKSNGAPVFGLNESKVKYRFNLPISGKALIWPGILVLARRI